MRKVSIFFLLTLFASAFWWTACKKTAQRQKVSTDSLHQQLQVMNDSVANAWQEMIADDDEKHAFMKRLLLEVTYTGNFDSAEYKAYMEKIKTLQDMRYTQLGLVDSDGIDRYDSATLTLTRQLTEYAEGHPEYEKFGLMKELIEDINAKNGMILLQRVHYDGFVKDRNAFIEANRDLLDPKNARYGLKKLPIFELPS